MPQLGVEHSEVAYVWPENLLRPEPGLRLVYLDLNHWIGLAKAATGHEDGARYQDALAALRQAKSTGSFLFPLSGTHYMELAGIASERHRADIAQVMEELSDFASLLTLAGLMRLEIDAAVGARLGPRPVPYEPVPLVGFGVGPAFGLRGGLRIRSSADGADVTDEQRDNWPEGEAAFDTFLADLNRRFERMMLIGPSREDEPQLRASGWDPTVARRIAENRAAAEQQLAAELAEDPQLRKRQVRDVVSATYLAFDANNLLEDALKDRHATLDDLITEQGAAREFTDSLPSADVFISLKTALHRNPQTRWTPNTMFDIDALSVAVPYCQVVAADHAAADALNRSGVAARLGTTVVSKPADLVTQLGS